MGLSINQNIAAFNSYRNLSATQGSLGKSLEKLSSGFRINRAADDAAGLAISEGLRSQVGGLKVASRNAQDGISVVQTAEGALTETHAILQRMRDLSVQSYNSGGLSTKARENIQAEMSQLQSEVTRIADTTQFNGTKLLDGAYNGTFQVGANVGESISVNVKSSLVASNGALNAAGLGIDKVDVRNAGAPTGIAVQVNGATAGTLNITVTGADFTDANLNAFKNLGGIVTMGGKSFDLAKVDYTGATDAGGARTAIENALSGAFGGGGVITVGAGAGNTSITISVAGPGAGAATPDINKNIGFDGTTTGSSNALKSIDKAITEVSTVRANLGAVQNRFEHTINNLNVAVENLSASESRIRDTDMASEMVTFTRNQILSQAGTAMLAQANQIPQGVLSLLR